MGDQNNNHIKKTHDLLVKASLSSPGAVEEFAKAYFPHEVLKRIDLRSLKLTNKSYVTEELKEFYNDLVFSFTIEDQPGYAYMLFEDQSTADFRMPLRFIQYNLALLEEYLKGKDQTARWPIIVNICLYHNADEKPYPYSTSVYDQFTNPYRAEKLGMFTRFHLVDLNNIPDKTLEEHGSTGLMAKLLKYSRRRDAFKVLAEELERSKEMVLIQGDYWKTILIYALHVIERKGNSEEKIVTLFREVLSKNQEEIMTTIAQVIEKRGEQRGMERGMQARNLAIAKNMLKLSLDVKLIQEATGLSKQTIEDLLEQG